jgi:hypothetical protein
VEASWLEGTMQCDRDGTPNTTADNATAREISFGTTNMMGEAEGEGELRRHWVTATGRSALTAVSGGVT